jgi:hypothetical protein
MGVSVLIMDGDPGLPALSRRPLEGERERVVGEVGDCGVPLQAARARFSPSSELSREAIKEGLP